MPTLIYTFRCKCLINNTQRGKTTLAPWLALRHNTPHKGLRWGFQNRPSGGTPVGSNVLLGISHSVFSTCTFVYFLTCTETLLDGIEVRRVRGNEFENAACMTLAPCLCTCNKYRPLDLRIACSSSHLCIRQLSRRRTLLSSG